MYTNKVIEISNKVSGLYPGRELPFLTESVHLLSGTKKQFYFFDNVSLLSPGFPVVCDILGEIFRDGTQVVFIGENQIHHLNWLVDHQTEDAAAAALALQKLKQLPATHLVQLGRTEKMPVAEMIDQIVSKYPDGDYTIICRNYPLMRKMNAVRFLRGKNVTVLYSNTTEGKPLLRISAEMPELPPMDAGLVPVDVAAEGTEKPAAPLRIEGSGAPLDLNTVIGNGAEGICYADSDQVYKVFHTVLPKGCGAEQKLRALCAQGSGSSSLDVCLPRQLICDAQDRVCGYVMRRANGVKLSAILNDRTMLQQYLPDRMAAVLLAQKLVTACLRLMYHGLIPMDLKPDNILVEHNADGTSRLTLIDLDSVQYRQYPSAVATAGFAAPWLEPEKAPYSCTLRTLRDFAYTLHTCVFMLLCNGRHPMTDMEDPDSGFVFTRRPEDSANIAMVAPYFKVYSNFPRSLKDHFSAYFMQKAEPSAEDPRTLLIHLANMESYLRATTAAANELWPENRKANTKETRVCSCCGRELPSNYMVHFKKYPKLSLCERCCAQTFPMVCEDCGDPIEFTLEDFLRCNDEDRPLPRYCDACEAILSVTDPDEEKTRPITYEDRLKAEQMFNAAPAAQRTGRDAGRGTVTPVSTAPSGASRATGAKNFWDVLKQICLS